jgi:hypothetical protein
MRAAGIPSRIIAGYQGGELNPAGDYMIVRQSDAHAWAEVWLAGQGWVRVDPTGAVAPERIEYGSEAVRRMLQRGRQLGELPEEGVREVIRSGWIESAVRRASLLWDAVNTRWNQWVLDFDHQSQRQLLKLLGFSTAGWINMVLVLVISMILFFLVAAAILLSRRQRPDPLKVLYGRFCRKLARVGLRRRDYEGPHSFAQRCMRIRPDLEPAISTITDLYVGMRYGKLETLSRLGQLRAAVKGFRPKKRSRPGKAA